MSHTHNLTFAEGTVTKRYLTWDRDEHRREWAALRQIHRHAPGLGPEPITADLTAVPPIVVMTVVPGESLGGHLTAGRIRALVTGISRLWAVPHNDPTIDGWRDDLHFARRLTDGPRPDGGVTADAFDAAALWWDGPDPELLSTTPRETVFGHRDANLANYLWDGTRVRIIDFEDSRASDAATELAILIEHLSARDLDADVFLAPFAVDGRRLLAARRLFAMFWLRLLLPGGPAAARNPPGTVDAQARRLLQLLS